MSKRSFSKKNRTSSHRNDGPKRRGRAPADAKPQKERTRVVGILEKTPNGFTITSSDRKDKNVYKILPSGAQKSQVGDLVVAQILSHDSDSGKSSAKVINHLGDPNDVRNISLIEIEQNEIPHEFSDAAIKEAEEAKPVTLKDRVDLRKIPLVTIDGEDARDFDDAVYAEELPNKQGWHLLVAIADVAHYVRPGSALDKTAYERGNSTYFPDRVVPMLPEALSNELCSLKPNVDRACMAVHLYLNAEGDLKKWEFVRGVMKSQARLTYNQVQEAHDGRPDNITRHLLPSIEALYGAYRCLDGARRRRGTLDLDIPERQVVMKKDGTVDYIKFRERLDAHKLIEEFMITANVAAASELEKHGCGTLYRIHDKPNEMKYADLRVFLESLLVDNGEKKSSAEKKELEDLRKQIQLLPLNDVKSGDIDRVLRAFEGHPAASAANEMILRAQAKAVYAPGNIGHFGLALTKYAHFTSPIRRYADLIVHRGLIRVKRFGTDGLTDHEMANLAKIGEAISGTEQRSASAERNAVDRFTTLYLADHVGDVFEGRISGVHKTMGCFIRLNDTGADGILRFEDMPRDRYRFDEKGQKFVGERTGREFRMMDPITVKLEKADKLTGSLGFSVYEEDERKKAPKRPMPKGQREWQGHRKG